MRTQVFLILGLLCFNAFGVFNVDSSITAVTISSTSWTIGTDDAGAAATECAVDDGTNDYVYTASAACTPEDLLKDEEGNLWAVFTSDTKFTLLLDSGAFDDSLYADTALTGTPVAVVLAKIDVSTANLGNVAWGSYILSGPTAGADDFTYTSLTDCTANTEYFILKGDTASTVDAYEISTSGGSLTATTDTGTVYYLINTSEGTYVESSTIPDCPTSSEESEESSAAILSVASVILGFLGLLTL